MMSTQRCQQNWTRDCSPKKGGDWVGPNL